MTLAALGFSDGAYRFNSRRERTGTGGPDSLLEEETVRLRKTGSVVEVSTDTGWVDAMPTAFPYFARDTLTEFEFVEGQPKLGLYPLGTTASSSKALYRAGTGLVSYYRGAPCGGRGCTYGTSITLLSATPLQ